MALLSRAPTIVCILLFNKFVYADDDSGSDGCSTNKMSKCATKAFNNENDWQDCDMCVCNNIKDLTYQSGECDASPENLFQCQVKYTNGNGYQCGITASTTLIVLCCLAGVVCLICCIFGCVRAFCWHRVRRPEPPKHYPNTMPNPIVVNATPIAVNATVEEGSVQADGYDYK
jgi:hypothetical protein